MRIGILYNINSDDPSNIDDNESKVIVKKFIEILNPFFNIFPIVATQKTLKLLSSDKIDFIFNICEGFNNNPSGESWVASTIELRNIPFSGSDSFTLAMCLRKHIVKQLLIQNNLRTPQFFYCKTLQEFTTLSQFNLSFPLIVKPAEQDASNGIDESSFVKNKIDLLTRVKKHFDTFSTGVIIEEYIEGREINVSVIGNGHEKRALPLSEILFDIPPEIPKILTYDSKWREDTLIYQQTYGVCPAEASDELKSELESMALKCFDLFNCKDYARVDFRIKDNIPYILEVNPNPGINSDSGLIRSATVAGFTYKDFILFILKTAFHRYSIPFILEKNPTVIINETQNIAIQDITFDDIKELHEWFNDKEIGKFMDEPDESLSDEEVINLIFLESTDRYHGLAILKESKEPIGYGSIYNFNGKTAEISYLIGNKNHLGKGYGKEIVENLCTIAKSKFNLHELVASVIDENIPSKKVLENNGFVITGTIATGKTNEIFFKKKL